MATPAARPAADAAAGAEPPPATSPSGRPAANPRRPPPRLADGWERRVAAKTLLAGGAGGAAGFATAMLRNGGGTLLGYTGSMAAAYGVFGGGFSVLQETMRSVRHGDEGPVNSFLAGAFVGAFLARVHAGPRAMAPGAVVWGTVMGGGHVAYDFLLRRQAQLLIDAEEEAAMEAAAAGTGAGRPAGRPGAWGALGGMEWPRWLPLQPVRNEDGSIRDTRVDGSARKPQV